MSSKSRALICVVGIVGLLNFADVAVAGHRRWYDGSRGWGHWQRRSVRLGWNPGWVGYNGRWAGYGSRHAYVRMVRRGNIGPGYRSQQYGLAMGGYGASGYGFGGYRTGGYGASYGAGGGYGASGVGQGSSGGYGSSYGGGASNSSGSSNGGGVNPDRTTNGGSTGGHSYENLPGPDTGDGIPRAVPDSNSTGTNALNSSRSLSSAMDYRPASYCTFCHTGGSVPTTNRALAAR